MGLLRNAALRSALPVGGMAAWGSVSFLAPCFLFFLGECWLSGDPLHLHRSLAVLVAMSVLVEMKNDDGSRLVQSPMKFKASVP